jgi:hypothetical protein
LDVTGGWHDAADLFKYLITSANATAQLLVAYEITHPRPESTPAAPRKGQSAAAAGHPLDTDRFEALGNPDANGIPDLLDEARWGLTGMLKLHPAPDALYHQVADDRDHVGFRLPPNDLADYGWGKGDARCASRAAAAMQKLVVILGTNASGKSDLGLSLAGHFGGEVIPADSRQVYRGLDLGRGKISPVQAALVKHHLIDVAEVSESFSLARYQRAAYDAIAAIAANGRLPFLVGGTGLYVSAIVEGYQLVDVPPNEALRAELERLPLAQLVQRLAQVDWEGTRRIHLVPAVREDHFGGPVGVGTRGDPPVDEQFKVAVALRRPEIS